MKKFFPLIYGALGAVLLCSTTPCLAVDMSIPDTVNYINARIKESLAMPGHRIVSSSFSVNEHYRIIYSYERSDRYFKDQTVPVELLSVEKSDVSEGAPGELGVIIGCEVRDCTSVQHPYAGRTKSYNSDQLTITMGPERRLAEKVRNALSHLITMAKDEQKRKDRNDPF